MIAQNLDPALGEASLDAFGPVGEIFARHRLRPLGEADSGLTSALGLPPSESPEVEIVESASWSLEAPIPIETPPAEPPPGASSDLWNRKLQIEFMVDAGGSVRAPVVVGSEEPPLAGKVVVGLEALRGWRFRPAPAADRPVVQALRLDPFRPPPFLLFDFARRPKLQPIHEAALDRRWEEADRLARAALEAEPEECIADGVFRNLCDFARLSLLRAVTATGAGLAEEAAWHRAVTLAFSPQLADAPVQGYGEPGRTVAALSTSCLVDDWERCPATPLRRADPAITPPRRLAGRPPRLPRPLAVRGGGRTILRAVIGSDGRPRDPVVIAGRFPVSRFLALQALADWRFEPARRAGEPVPVAVEMSVHLAVDAPDEQVDAWRRRLDEIDQTLRAGDWALAASLAEPLVDEISVAATHGGSDLLADAVAGIALADAGRGRTADALWSWQLAQNLAYELRWADLSDYGTAGDLLAAHPLRRPGELPDGTRRIDDSAFGSLLRVAGEDAVYPQPHQRAVPVVEVVLRDGRAESPVVLTHDPPAVILAALRAIREWRLSPISGGPTMHRLSVPHKVTPGDPELDPTTRKFANLARRALRFEYPARADECYWSQVPHDVRHRLGAEYDQLKIAPLQHEGDRFLSSPLQASSRRREPDPDGPKMVGAEVRKPVRIRGRQPAYTEMARKARITGVVIVQTIIDRNGDVRSAQVLKGLPMGLSEQAVETLCQWKFRPATLNGRPVDVFFNQTVTFMLQ